MIPIRRVWDAGRIGLVLRRRNRRMIAVRVRMGIETRDVRMIVIRGVEMNVARRHRPESAARRARGTFPISGAA
jgi:hypothetical protein